jgi:heme-degrading monooxygenase HmoA
MFARVSTISGNHVPEVIKYFEEATATDPSEVPGLEKMKGSYILKDNKHGKVMTITLWETKEDMEKSLPKAKEILEGTVPITGMPPLIEFYEVALKS